MIKISPKQVTYIVIPTALILLLLHLIFPAEKKKESTGSIKETPPSTVTIPQKKTTPEPEKQQKEINDKKLPAKEKPISRNKPGVPQKIISTSTRKKIIKEHLFIKKLEKDIPLFGDARLAEMVKSLLHSEKTDPANFAVQFIASENPKVRKFGLDIAEGICIHRPNSFRPNEFFKAFAKEGFEASHYLSKIIAGTDDDFIREWACELWSDIYYHNSQPGNSRHFKLEECKKSEKNIYNFLQEVLNDKEQLKNIQKTRGPLGNIIIKEWGNENRIPLKMIALISIFDLMGPKNSDACAEKALKIINTYNFNYNILGRVNNKQLDRPPMPEEAILKKLSDDVFRNKYTDTFKWVKKEDGGFSLEEMKIAVETKERQKMKQMISVLKKIITDVLKAKLLIGSGQNEIELLRYFSSKTWDNKPFDWNNKMLTLRNPHKNSVTLIISSDRKGEDAVTFLIPGRNKFIWFLPEGKYKITTEPTSEIGFIPKTVNIEKDNITIEM